MILVAALHKGVDFLKDEQTQNLGKFYAYAGKTHEKLKDK